MIESSARRGSSLTRQLLTFARKTETITAPVDINSLVQETLDLYQRSVSKDVTVRTNLADTPLTVNGDDGQIQQALLNLFLNARDAMNGAGTLTVTTQLVTADTLTGSRFSSTRPGPFVKVHVNDTGRGIPRDIQTGSSNRSSRRRITAPDPGCRSSTASCRTTKAPWILRERRGGRHHLHHLPPHTAGIQAEARKRRPRLPHGTEHILVVDDEAYLCEVARDILTNLGYTVYIASNGQEGVEFYKTRQASIDLVLLDINMPVMSGIEE